MSDSRDEWRHESYGDDGGAGLLWRTGRNVAVILAGCLLVLGVMNWRSAQIAEPGTKPALEQPQNAGSAPAQIARTTSTGAEMVIPPSRNGHFMVTAEIEGWITREGRRRLAASST